MICVWDDVSVVVPSVLFKSTFHIAVAASFLYACLVGPAGRSISRWRGLHLRSPRQDLHDTNIHSRHNIVPPSETIAYRKTSLRSIVFFSAMHLHWKLTALAVSTHILPTISASTSSPPKPTGCHSPYDSTFIFFRAGADPGFDFGIKTRHELYYPRALREALQLYTNSGFSLGSSDGRLDRADECGWQKVKTVKVDSWDVGGKRGTIYWKYSDLHTIRDTKGLNPHWAPTSANHIPPQKPAMPSNYTLGNIEQILKLTAPTADVYYNEILVLEPAVVVLGSLVSTLFLLGVMVRLLDRKRAVAAAAAPQDMELAPIVHDSTTKLTETPEIPVKVEIPRSIRFGTQEHSGSAQTEPPPRYSFGSPILVALPS